jgi:methylated-DNA-[protein]-cysteine S-methyltransferase
MHMSTRRVRHYQTPWGTGSVWVSEGHLVAVDLPQASQIAEAAEGPSRPVGQNRDGPAQPSAHPAAIPASDAAALTRWTEELEAYFRGERLSWTPDEIVLEALSPGPFERAVYLALLSVPAGATVAYGELAEMAGHPRAARAVGNVMAANPIPIVIPCHRVIRADGALGNYGDDPEWKKRLLAHERASVRASEEAE